MECSISCLYVCVQHTTSTPCAHVCLGRLRLYHFACHFKYKFDLPINSWWFLVNQSKTVPLFVDGKIWQPTLLIFLHRRFKSHFISYFIWWLCVCRAFVCVYLWLHWISEITDIKMNNNNIRVCVSVCVAWRLHALLAHDFSESPAHCIAADRFALSLRHIFRSFREKIWKITVNKLSKCYGFFNSKINRNIILQGAIALNAFHCFVFGCE